MMAITITVPSRPVFMMVDGHPLYGHTPYMVQCEALLISPESVESVRCMEAGREIICSSVRPSPAPTVNSQYANSMFSEVWSRPTFVLNGWLESEPTKVIDEMKLQQSALGILIEQQAMSDESPLREMIR